MSPPSRLPELLQGLPDPAIANDDGSDPPALGGLDALQQALGYRFRRPALLRVALTLGSWTNEHLGSGWPSNASLEFFGDAVLDLVAADVLWRQFPALGEGVLTRLRASLVAEAGLVPAARQLALGDHLYLGRGDAKRGGREHVGALADAMEAVFGAVFLDAREAGDDGLAAAEGVFRVVFASALEGVHPGQARDPKSRLQEWAQGRYRLTPYYVRALDEPSSPGGPWHARVELRFSETHVLVLGEGTGRNLREAERAAAEAALHTHAADST